MMMSTFSTGSSTSSTFPWIRVITEKEEDEDEEERRRKKKKMKRRKMKKERKEEESVYHLGIHCP